MDRKLLWKVVLCFCFFMMTTQGQVIEYQNKIIPESVKDEVIDALEYFPELEDTEIEFRFKDRIKKSTMQAQPKFISLFRNKENRKYIILMSRQIQIDEEDFTMDDIPSDVKIGWFGHELGHIMDYQERTNVDMAILGLTYLISSKSVRKVERTADTYAIGHGMGEYILKTKNFILDHSSISERYKERIRRLYISPEEVMELINEGSLEEIEELESMSN